MYKFSLSQIVVLPLCLSIVLIATDEFSAGREFIPNEALQNDSIKTGRSYRKIETKAFTVGEELTFDVNYGFVTAGEAKMSIPSYQTIFDRKCYQLLFTVNSKPFFDWMYKVRDRYESLLDIDGLFPWKFEQSIREGGYSKDFVARFDQERGIAYANEKTYPIPPFVQDILSAFYFVRSVNYDSYRPGQKMWFKNFYKDTTYALGVKYCGRQELSVEAGKFKTIILEPLIKEGGLFKASGRILLWVTDDDRKMPVQVEAEIPIGSITSELTKYKGLAGPLTSRIGDD